MSNARFDLNDLPMEDFAPELVDPISLSLAKGASLVEFNAGDYVEYLNQVFAGDPDFLEKIREWGEEERQHGSALAAWCRLADAEFDFDAAMKRFTDAYRVPQAQGGSLRGSQARELIARCVIESGTTMFYTALRDFTKEPLLRAICGKIAADEVHHYQLFKSHLSRQTEGNGKLSLAKTIFERAMETDDEELSFAWIAANQGQPLDPARKVEYAKDYMAVAVKIMRPKHFQHCTQMILKAGGFSAQPWVTKPMSRVLHKTLAWKARGGAADFVRR
jgi:hypothetical protein